MNTIMNAVDMLLAVCLIWMVYQEFIKKGNK